MSEEQNYTIDVQQIMKRIPHRYPFLLIDKVEDIMPGESACRHQKRNHERTAFYRSFSRFSGHAGRSHCRSHGADSRHQRLRNL